MNHIRLFENFEDYQTEFTPAQFKKFSCWYIDGNMITILNVIKKMNQIAKYEIDFKKIQFRLTNDEFTNSISGIIFYFGIGFSYSIVEDKKKSLNIIEETDVYDYKGELKIIDDKLVLDTLELDANKYNL